MVDRQHANDAGSAGGRGVPPWGHPRGQHRVLHTTVRREVPEPPAWRNRASPRAVQGGTMSQAFRVTDAIPLPEPGEPLTGRATREDTYPITVCRTFADAVDDVVRWLGDAAV